MTNLEIIEKIRQKFLENGFEVGPVQTPTNLDVAVSGVHMRYPEDAADHPETGVQLFQSIAVSELEADQLAVDIEHFVDAKYDAAIQSIWNHVVSGYTALPKEKHENLKQLHKALLKKFKTADKLKRDYVFMKNQLIPEYEAIKEILEEAQASENRQS